MTTTNVLQILGFSQIPYRIFSLPPTNAKTAPAPTTLANDLRRAQIALLRKAQLASIKNGELWTFSQDGLQSAPVPEESSGLQEISTGTLFASQLLTMTETPARGATTQTIRNGPAHENFLSAVRALVEFTFLQKAEYQILGNWLIPPSTDDQGQDGLRLLLPSIYTPSPCRGMFKLNVNLAASGELYIAPERNSSILLQRVNAVPPPVEGTLLFLSPSGARAEFVSILPSTSQTSPILQKIRMTTGLEAKFPLMRVRLTGSGVDTLWPVNLAFQKCASRNITSLDTIDYFNLKDGVSAAVKLISDALTYKPPPAPSPAIPPSVAAHVTPSGAYHTPPDGLVRTKPASLTGQTPTVNQNSQEDWITSTKDEDDIWPAVTNVRDEDETFMFDESVFDLEEEDFDFFDDGPSGEIDETLETLVSEFRPPEEQTMVVAEPRPQPVEEMRLERPSSPPPEEHEPQMVLSPPYSPLRILPSPPPSKRGSFPRVWDHVRLSGNLEKLQDKYRRGGKYWCDDLDENALEDDSMSESSSEDERVDIMATNPRKRKRDGDEDEGNSTVRINGPTIGAQNLDSDSISLMTRAIDDNFLLLQNPRDDFIKRMPKRDDRQGAYTSGLDTDEFIALAETVAAQVAWDGLVAVNNDREQDTISLDDFNSVVTEIWGMDAANNPGLKELTEVTDNLPSDEEESPQMKTPRMKPVRSHNPPASTLSLSGLEQTPSIYPIPPSSFLVHRIVNRVAPAPNHTQRLSVSQPALRFWEKFSFSPVAGEKDVQCYIVHPDSDGMAAAAESFLSEVQTGWESCGMGKFERGKVNEGKDGMIAISVPPNAEEDMYLSAYEDALVAFGRGLSKLPNNWLKNILVLIVNPFSIGSAVVPLCKAFLGFKNAYFAGVDNPATIPTSHVALQIVPVKMIAGKEGLLMRGLEFQSFMRRLYDLCEVMEATTTANPKPTSRARDFLTSPATYIASPPPTSLEFTDSFPFQYRNLLKDSSTLHLAYSVSIDNRWITAVWTDDWGQVSLKESYCFTRLTTGSLGGKYQQTFENICDLIWRRTLDIVKQARISWRVIIVRAGGMSKSEIGIWKSLNQTDTPGSPTRIQLVLGCIDLNPALAVSVVNTGAAAVSPLAMISTPFPSSSAVFSQASPAAIGNAYGTPVATPLAAANESPDPSGGIMSTPGGTITNIDNASEFDPDARWVDATDEVWAIVLNHRVPACPATDSDQEIRFSLASGFLWPVKSALNYTLVQVHLLHIDKPLPVSTPPPDTLPNTYAREILKQLLSQYRGLSSLGVIRGVSFPEKIVPWHVCAAERIKDVFFECM